MECKGNSASPSTKKTVDYFRSMFGNNDIQCAYCHKKLDELHAMYFKSPTWTWDLSCGSAGWLVICTGCKRQVFFMNETE